MEKLGKRTLIVGVGLHGGGRSAILYCLKMGLNVRITDIKKKSELVSTLSEFPKLKGTFGTWKKEDVSWADSIIKNPGVPETSPIIRYALQKKKPIFSDIAIFYESLGRQPDIAVTGTRGKSTTVAMIDHLLGKKQKTFAAGNNRNPVLQQKKFANATIILELSSWQIDDAYSAKVSPHIAVWTNLYPDHLDRYKTMKRYFSSKKKLFKFQNKNDFAVLNYDQPILRTFAKKLTSKPFFFSLHPLPKNVNGTFLDKGRIYFKNAKGIFFVLPEKEIPLLGSHNTQNTLAAILTSFLFGYPISKIRDNIKTFHPPKGRLEFVRNLKGRLFFNDTTATNVEGFLAAHNAFSKSFPKSNLSYIVGGASKGFSYASLRRVSKLKNVKWYVLPGTASKKLTSSLSPKASIKYCETMQDAVKSAYHQSKPGEIIALSPAAASFGLFKHAYDRGGTFIRVVRSLK